MGRFKNQVIKSWGRHYRGRLHSILHTVSVGAIGLYVLSTAHAQGAERDSILAEFNSFTGVGQISDSIQVFKVQRKKLYPINGSERMIGGAFQPSTVMDGSGRIHIFFQARLDSSEDWAEKMTAHVVSEDAGRTFSEPTYLYPKPLQNYAMSPFLRTSESGGERISVLTCVSLDETLERYESPEATESALGIDISALNRKAGSIILEFFSDDGGMTWERKEHRQIVDRVYRRSGRDFYLAFMNLIGQVRRIDEGPYAGRLILAGPIRGDYLPCDDHPKFRDYSASSAIIYSDDNGESWQLGGLINDATAFDHNEASAVSVNNGQQILMVRRSIARDAPGKILHYSNDGGESWEEGFISTIDATRCMQVLDTYEDLIMCSSPEKDSRTRGQIYYSRDAGKTWANKQIVEKMFSYSTVNHLIGPYFICAWSQAYHGEFGIAARIFSVEWLDSP